MTDKNTQSELIHKYEELEAAVTLFVEACPDSKNYYAKLLSKSLRELNEFKYRLNAFKKKTMTLFIILSSLFFSSAALLNAGGDSLTHHYNTSFAEALELDDKFWNPAQSWKNKYIDGDPTKGRKKINLLFFKFDIPAAFTDGWHLLKSTSIFFLILCPLVLLPGKFRYKLILFAVLAICWNTTFNIFYGIKF